ncbi:MAG: methyl-accepting chemotaxis protein [Fibromonadaceae bacterium]|jgi:methyl-accepting chemotaxis protein|nr:methyl-accepting chemotaxis protein [Fibromonadaceae bacterium]
MQLKHKIPLILFAAYCLLVGSLTAVTLYNSAKVHRAGQYETAKAKSRSRADMLESFLEARIAELKSFERSIIVLQNKSDAEKEELISNMLCQHIKAPESRLISDIYFSSERGAYFNEELTEPEHHFNIECFRTENGSIEPSIDPNEEIEADDDWYHMSKDAGKAYLTEPYEYTYPGEQNARSMITLSYPVFLNEKFAGVIGMDLEINLLKDFFDKMSEPEIGSYVSFISNEGLKVVHPNRSLILQKAGAGLSKEESEKMLEAISNGESYLIIGKTAGQTSITSYEPVVAENLLPWALAYVAPLSAFQTEEVKTRWITIIVILVSTILWGIFLIWLMASTFGNLTHAISAIRNIADGEGDLTIRMKERGNDELGEMAKKFNVLMDKLHTTIRTTQKDSKNLLDTSSVLLELSLKLSKYSQATLEQSANVSQETVNASTNARTIASEAERTSTGVHELAGTVEQMSASMHCVSDTVKELSCNFVQITNSTIESRKIAIEATEKAADATSVMSKLGFAAKEIGQVTDVIKKIADKTNLLALNATIEAASAGEAGKGFAVVASEIKELANQSATSADDIAHRIESIQDGTDNAVEVINNVANIIDKINASIVSIASNIEQQTKASNEIANSAEQTSVSTKRVVGSIDEFERAAKESAHNANGVAQSAENISTSIDSMYKDAKKSNSDSIELEKAANELKSMAEHLDSIVRKFKT